MKLLATPQLSQSLCPSVPFALPPPQCLCSCCALSSVLPAPIPHVWVRLIQSQLESFPSPNFPIPLLTPRMNPLFLFHRSMLSWIEWCEIANCTIFDLQGLGLIVVTSGYQNVGGTCSMDHFPALPVSAPQARLGLTCLHSGGQILLLPPSGLTLAEQQEPSCVFQQTLTFPPSTFSHWVLHAGLPEGRAQGSPGPQHPHHGPSTCIRGPSTHREWG